MQLELDTGEEIDIEAEIAKLKKFLSFDGKKVVVTGILRRHTRPEIHKLLEKHGAKTSGSVSSKTDILIVGEKPGATKVFAAMKHDTLIMREQDFWEIINA